MKSIIIPALLIFIGLAIACIGGAISMREQDKDSGCMGFVVFIVGVIASGIGLIMGVALGY